APDAGAGEPLLGKRDPPPHLVGHEARERLLAVGRVGGQAVVLGPIAPVGVEAVEPDPLLHVLDLVGRDDLVPAEDAGLVTPVSRLDHGNHHLAGDVPSHDQRVGLVELRGVQELAPALLGAVHVAGVVEFHACASRARARAWSEIISQAMFAARSAVGWPGESYDGETSTT